ncbi:MAG: thymidylate kinase [Terracidiphilus sp.]
MHSSDSKRTAILVSFSGIDGAGKSTQINALFQRLQNIGTSVKLIRFWDDVSKLKWIRESIGHSLFKGDKGIGSPDAPITRKDKNVQSWPMTCIRLALYFFDAISARTAVNKSLRSDADFVIFDRYCYDEIANLNLQSALLRRYVKLLLRFVPKLDRSYLLDADPFQARMRKPEYPLDFVYRNWAAYLEMQKLTERMIVILPGSVDDVEREIWRLTLDGLHPPSNAGKGQGSSPRQHDMGANTLDGSYTRPAA